MKVLTSIVIVSYYSPYRNLTKVIASMKVIENCMNCEEGVTCYECYILSGQEAFDIARMARHHELYASIWCNHYASFEAYYADVERIFYKQEEGVK